MAMPTRGHSRHGVQPIPGTPRSSPRSPQHGGAPAIAGWVRGSLRLVSRSQQTSSRKCRTCRRAGLARSSPGLCRDLDRITPPDGRHIMRLLDGPVFLLCRSQTFASIPFQCLPTGNTPVGQTRITPIAGSVVAGVMTDPAKCRTKPGLPAIVTIVPAVAFRRRPGRWRAVGRRLPGIAAVVREPVNKRVGSHGICASDQPGARPPAIRAGGHQCRRRRECDIGDERQCRPVARRPQHRRRAANRVAIRVSWQMRFLMIGIFWAASTAKKPVPSETKDEPVRIEIHRCRSARRCRSQRQEFSCASTRRRLKRGIGS